MIRLFLMFSSLPHGLEEQQKIVHTMAVHSWTKYNYQSAPIRILKQSGVIDHAQFNPQRRIHVI